MGKAREKHTPVCKTATAGDLDLYLMAYLSGYELGPPGCLTSLSFTEVPENRSESKALQAAKEGAPSRAAPTERTLSIGTNSPAAAAHCAFAT